MKEIIMKISKFFIKVIGNHKSATLAPEYGNDNLPSVLLASSLDIPVMSTNTSPNKFNSYPYSLIVVYSSEVEDSD